MAPHVEPESFSLIHAPLLVTERDHSMLQGFSTFGRAAALILAAAFTVSCGDSKSPQASAPVFISMPVQDRILKVDPQSGVILSQTEVGRLPHHMVVDHNSRRLYVVLSGSQAVAEIDTDTGALLRTMLTEPVPETRPDGSRIDAHFDQNAFAQSNCGACHRGGTDGVKPTIVGSRPFGISLAEDGASLFVTNTRSGSISQIELASGQIIQRLNIDASQSAVEPTALARLGDQLFTSVLAPQPSPDAAVLKVLDAKTGQASREVATGPSANFVLADTQRQQLYVANFETNTISVFGLTGEKRAIYTVGPGPQGMQLTPDGRQLVVANYYGNSMSLVSLDTGEVTTFPLQLAEQKFANPSHLVITNDGATALVAASGTKGHLLQINLARRLIENALPIGPLPFDITAAPTATQ